MVQRYPTDLTDTEWTVLTPLIPTGQTRWPPAYDRHARGGQCHLLHSAEWVPMADAPARVSAVPDSLRLLLALAPRRRLGTDTRHAAGRPA